MPHLMAETLSPLCTRMSSPSPTPDKCREARRRRRIQLMRRYSTTSAAPGAIVGRAGPGSSSRRAPAAAGETQGNHRQLEHGPGGTSLARTMSLPHHYPPQLPSPPGLSPTTTTPDTCPPPPPTWLSLGIGVSATDVADHAAAPPTVPRFGSVSLAGRCREMEDAVTVMPCFYPPRTGDQLRGSASPVSHQFHVFAVFDGHGGSHVSALCKDRIHLILAEELTNALGDAPPYQPTIPDAAIWAAALCRCFARLDQLALASCTCGGSSACCDLHQTGLTTYIVGSTAVVAVVGRDQIVVANCGDSRAVLGRGGHAVALSADHKPDRPDELARIEEAGSKVIHLNGAPRVMGILAMSRAIDWASFDLANGLSWTTMYLDAT